MLEVKPDNAHSASSRIIEPPWVHVFLAITKQSKSALYTVLYCCLTYMWNTCILNVYFMKNAKYA